MDWLWLAVSCKHDKCSWSAFVMCDFITWPATFFPKYTFSFSSHFTSQQLSWGALCLLSSFFFTGTITVVQCSFPWPAGWLLGGILTNGPFMPSSFLPPGVSSPLFPTYRNRKKTSGWREMKKINKNHSKHARAFKVSSPHLLIVTSFML